VFRYESSFFGVGLIMRLRECRLILDRLKSIRGKLETSSYNVEVECALKELSLVESSFSFELQSLIEKEGGLENGGSC
jgi:hypothetical protein